MQIQNKLLIIMTIIVVLGILGTGYFWGRNEAAKKQIKLVEELNNAKLVAKDVELSKLAIQVTVSIGKIEKLENENIKIKQDLVDNQEELISVKEKLKDAKPETLLAETRRIIDTKEIWLIDEKFTKDISGANAIGAEFSLSAFRQNAWVLTDWENFTLVREPKYIQLTVNSSKEITEQKIVIADLGLINKTWEEKYDILNNSFSEWKKYIQKKKNIFSWLIDFALKVGIGYAIGHLSK